MKGLKKKLICACGVLVVCVSLTAPSLAKPGPAGPGGAGPAAGVGAGPASNLGTLTSLEALPGWEGLTTTDLWPTTTVTQSAETLWTQFSQAEANKKLLELQEKTIRDQIHLLEHGGYYYLYSADSSAAYTQLLELKSQQYQLQLAREQYESQKKQAEYQLQYLGERPGKAELEYLFYTGALTPSGQSYQTLQTQLVSLRWQEENLNTQMKALEYQLQLGQITDSQFVSQYAQLFLQKEEVKLQREQVDAEIKVTYGALGPGLGVGPGLLP